MVVKHNLSAMNNERYLSIVTGREADRSEKLSSGYRINRAADDAAGLSISEKMRKQIRGLTQASDNAQDGISLLQTAEGALHEVHFMLQRMNELAVQAANGTHSKEDRAYLQGEVAQIITEVDRVATSTKFNEIYLLDGSCAAEKTAKKADAAVTQPKIIVFDVTNHAVTTQQSPHYRVTGQPTEWDTVKRVLKEEIVPQAVTSLLATFSDTFGYLAGSDIGIGLQVYENNSSGVLAAVAMRSAYIAGTPAIVDLGFSLQVNISFLSLDDTNNHNLTPASRRNLESTIVHEMMHALMDEALTAGMAGYDQNMQRGSSFPLWFIEGTAQAAGGGADYVTGGLRIDGGSSIANIQTQLGGTNRLGSNTSASQYATGYLAVMYLGYLASGGTSMQETDIAAGIDQILNDVRGGKSLNQAIADNTNNQYTGISDFEAKFAQDGAAFVKDIMTAAGTGRGALVTGDFQEADLLQDAAQNQPLFSLNTDYEEVFNEYPAGYVVMSGGMAAQNGVAGPDYVNTGGGGTTTPGTGGGGTTPGTGGGGGGTTPGTAGGTPAGTVRAGSVSGSGLSLHIGSEAGHNMIIRIEAMSAADIGIEEVDISFQEGATNAITTIGEALHRVSSQRSSLGAYQNRLEHTICNLDNVVENTQAAESQIRDADMAREMLEYSNLSILRQAGQAMLSQSKQVNQGVLALLM